MQPEEFREMRRRRLDVPGRKSARIERASGGRRLVGGLGAEEIDR